MPKLPVDRFVELLDRSGLLKKDQVEPVLATLKEELGGRDVTEGQVLADRLVQQRLITRWQASKLMEGRHKGFFLKQYRLLDHLGSGGMSSVYLAEHMVMERRVAIKVLPENKVNDSSYLPRFHREARAAAALDHANIVRAYDVDREGDVHFLVMEYVDGRNLQEIVAKEGPLPFDVAADYIRQAADGLSHAHAVGLVHRDIKPANLLVDTRKTVKVLDMGLARFEDDARASLTVAYDENVLGTADYLSPEQAIASHDADGRADLYSLGCTLYFLLTGHPPFPTGSLGQRIAMHCNKEPEPVTKDRPDAPADLVAICERMMAKAREKRYQSAEEVRDAMAQWQMAQVVGAGSYGTHGAPWSPPRGSLLSFGPGGSSIDARHMADASGNSGPISPPQPRTSPNDTAKGSDQDTMKSRNEELRLAPDEPEKTQSGASRVLQGSERSDVKSPSKKGDSRTGESRKGDSAKGGSSIQYGSSVKAGSSVKGGSPVKGGSSTKGKLPPTSDTPPAGSSAVRKAPGATPSGETPKIQLAPMATTVSLAGKLPASSGSVPVLNLPGQNKEAEQKAAQLKLGLIIGGAVLAVAALIGIIAMVM